MKQSPTRTTTWKTRKQSTYVVYIIIIKCNTTHLTAQWKLCPGESIWCSPSRLWIDNAFRFLTALICKNSMSNSLSTTHPIFGKSPIHKNIWRLTHLRAHSHPLTLCSPSRLWIDFGFSQICKIPWATLYRRRIQYLADRTRSTRIPTLPQLNKWCETFPLYYYLPALGMVWNTNWCKIQHCWCLCQRLIMYLVQWSSIFAKKRLDNKYYLGFKLSFGLSSTNHIWQEYQHLYEARQGASASFHGVSWCLHMWFLNALPDVSTQVAPWKAECSLLMAPSEAVSKWIESSGGRW